MDVRDSFKRSVLLCSCWSQGTPLILGLDLMVITRGYIVNTNNSGDKGHPCRVSLWISIGKDLYPCFRICIDVCIKSPMFLYKIRTKPQSFQDVKQIIPQHTSKALGKSKDNNIAYL